MSLGPCPTEIKACQHFMKLADDHAQRNLVVAYYARMSAIQLAMKILPGTKPTEVSQYLMSIMDWLEVTKKEHGATVEGLNNETIAQALIEEYMLKLYEFAYTSDCQDRFGKNMVKAYYTASLLCEVLTQFGPLSEDLDTKCMTAKYRATYIHNMLKNGQEPMGINVTIIRSEEDEKKLLMTEEELNERRALRGEGPIADEPPMDPEEYERKRKVIDEIRKRGNPEFEAELDRIKQRIDEETEDISEDQLFQPIYPLEPIIPDKIIDLGPPIYDDTPNSDQSSGAATTPIMPQPDALETSTNIAALDPTQTEKAMKYCKWASSALNYDDIKTAVSNLEKALYLCKFGKEKQ
ncbi:PREDICTED: vacuolar protein sorting-associated protein VTA1 homolog [Nicrophorus vespilloides]|uniref:Vacuolar protein sorting-associated protein VTA1 homolog n=1 Tax=Nicrophorus vespilloides TaxID=110193 RepID=A0ABM1MRY1_NICVS|nr:PREDICTED: vacuolar protein sorting-associated protein VTA1 homolog [Nicrophorus vespilloides]